MPEPGTGTGTESAPETGTVIGTGTVTEPESAPPVEMLDWPECQAEYELMTEQRQEGASHPEIMETIRRAREHITVDPETVTPEQTHKRDRMHLHWLESAAGDIHTLLGEDQEAMDTYGGALQYERGAGALRWDAPASTTGWRTRKRPSGMPWRSPG